MESSQSQPVTQQSACERLACVVKALGTLHYSKLDELKRNERQLNRPDFVWHFLVLRPRNMFTKSLYLLKD